MKKSILGIVLAIAGVVSLRATPVDPVFSIPDPDEGTPIFSSSFTFQANSQGGGILSFINESGFTWDKLDFIVNLPSMSSFACAPEPFFSFCLIQPTEISGGRTTYDIALIGPGTRGGIGDKVPFSINLNDFISDGVQNPDPNGAGGWEPNNSFAGTANAPEPSSIALLLAGAGLVTWGLRRRRVI